MENKILTKFALEEEEEGKKERKTPFVYSEHVGIHEDKIGLWKTFLG